MFIFEIFLLFTKISKRIENLLVISYIFIIKMPYISIDNGRAETAILKNSYSAQL